MVSRSIRWITAAILLCIVVVHKVSLTIALERCQVPVGYINRSAAVNGMSSWADHGIVKGELRQLFEEFEAHKAHMQQWTDMLAEIVNRDGYDDDVGTLEKVVEVAQYYPDVEEL